MSARTGPHYAPARTARRSLLVALFCSLAALTALTVSCASARIVPVEEMAGALPASAARFARPGPLEFTVESGVRGGVYGCTVSYEIYRPDEGPSGGPMVFLAHGFMRDLSSMRGWAGHWASFGVPVTVVSFCNSSPFAGRHDRNAEDLADLAAALHDGPVLYGGFSAGGLAALIAAAADPRATAYLGLDAVDSGGLAAPAFALLAVPALFLTAEPSSCNASNNMLSALTPGPAATILRVKNSTHCHFEHPTDSACSWICGTVKPEEAAEEIVDTIRALATAWVISSTTGDDEALEVIRAAADGGPEWTARIEPIRD